MAADGAGGMRVHAPREEVRRPVRPEQQYEEAPLRVDGPLSAEDLLKLQRTAGNHAVDQLVQRQSTPGDRVREVTAGGGSALPDRLRAQMQQSFGQDFSDVRVHTGPSADESAKAVAAKAYTVGSHIVFGNGGYSPDTESGQHLIAHELTHVVQQRSGAVAGTETADGLSISSPSDSYEQQAEATASAVQRHICSPGGGCH